MDSNHLPAGLFYNHIITKTTAVCCPIGNLCAPYRGIAASRLRIRGIGGGASAVGQRRGHARKLDRFDVELTLDVVAFGLGAGSPLRLAYAPTRHNNFHATVRREAVHGTRR